MILELNTLRMIEIKNLFNN
ncbi:hypothetical protein Godav_028071 [Gossypium davidsonii]|uniref:Uncharacterized protein n=2 Tax=Gossypium TaxID=3633 RepID=A0A7J8RYS6_GOSDV|nr:hypothetical protein [Gossypium davidsonii]MBA0654154.1 hypothetical protein [Gossypium klotzschianum]